MFPGRLSYVNCQTLPPPGFQMDRFPINCAIKVSATPYRIDIPDRTGHKMFLYVVFRTWNGTKQLPNINRHTTDAHRIHRMLNIEQTDINRFQQTLFGFHLFRQSGKCDRGLTKIIWLAWSRSFDISLKFAIHNIAILDWLIDYCPILIMPSAWLGSDKNNILCHLFDSIRIRTRVVESPNLPKWKADA